MASVVSNQKDSDALKENPPSEEAVRHSLTTELQSPWLLSGATRELTSDVNANPLLPVPVVPSGEACSATAEEDM